jgi:hypothetical protein
MNATPDHAPDPTDPSEAPDETPDALRRWALARLPTPDEPAAEPETPRPPTLDERREELVDLAGEGSRLFLVARMPSGERRCCTGVIVDVGYESYRLRQAEGRERVFKIALLERVERRP